MSDFKVGDVIFFLHDSWTDTSTGPRDLVIGHEEIEPCHDLEWFKKDGDGRYFLSKQECIDAFKRRLDEL